MVLGEANVKIWRGPNRQPVFEQDFKNPFLALDFLRRYTNDPYEIVALVSYDNTTIGGDLAIVLNTFPIIVLERLREAIIEFRPKDEWDAASFLSMLSEEVDKNL